MKITKRQAIAAVAASFVFGIGSAFAQGYPERPVRIVVPFPPGGGNDIIVRAMTDQMSKSLGQQVLVDNKPGAGTVIGVDNVAKSAADGYSFVTVTGSFAVNQTLLKKLPYDGLKDFRAVGLMGLSEHVLVTHPGSGFKSVADLVAQAKAGKPLSYASFGNGSSAHMAGEMLKNQLNLDIVHVPYKGQAPALNDLLGGQVSMMFANWPEVRGHVQSGKLVAVGMATAQRSVYAPNVPTLAEQGVKLESSSWNGLLAPAGVPDAIVQRMNAAINDAMKQASVVEALNKAGIAARTGTPQQFGDFLTGEIARYAEVIRQGGITAEN